jgi:hypothetical protein
MYKSNRATKKTNAHIHPSVLFEDRPCTIKVLLEALVKGATEPSRRTLVAGDSVCHDRHVHRPLFPAV